MVIDDTPESAAEYVERQGGSTHIDDVLNAGYSKQTITRARRTGLLYLVEGVDVNIRDVLQIPGYGVDPDADPFEGLY